MRHCMWSNVQAQAQNQAQLGPSGTQENQDTSPNSRDNGKMLLVTVTTVALDETGFICFTHYIVH